MKLNFTPKDYMLTEELKINPNRLARRFLIMRDIPCTPENIAKAQKFIDELLKNSEAD